MSAVRTLRADEIECRPQQIKKSKTGNVGAILLLYKDARCDMNILDETYGPMGWRRNHEIIGGNLFCTVSVYDKQTGAWVDKVMGSVNLDDYESRQYMDRMLQTAGIYAKLEEMGIEENAPVIIGELEFEYVY